VRYRQAPLLLRYAVAWAAWLGIVAGDLLIRVAFVPFLPILWLRSMQSQEKAQTFANLADFYVRPLMRAPSLRNRSGGAAKRLVK
jgi:hypothetical protein